VVSVLVLDELDPPSPDEDEVVLADDDELLVSLEDELPPSVDEPPVRPVEVDDERLSFL
jgi:hypothetical protein